MSALELPRLHVGETWRALRHSGKNITTRTIVDIKQREDGELVVHYDNEKGKRITCVYKTMRRWCQTAHLVERAA